MKSPLEQIVNAILYEGYILYPYRASSKKNQRERFTFGRVYPQAFSESTSGAEACAMQAECLIQTRGRPACVKVSLGFLQPVMRKIGALEHVLDELPEDGEVQYQHVPQLEVGERIFQEWMEAIERNVPVVVEDFTRTKEIHFAFPAKERREAIRNENGEVSGVIFRRQEPLEGRIEIQFAQLQTDLFRIRLRAVNVSPIEPGNFQSPEAVLLKTFASTHFTLELENGEFVSLLETPPQFKEFACECQNIGCWPVLVGNEGAHGCTTILASPIILYDYPKIAPESAGEFFDGTEIDEMLTLRVLTLTDEEKRQMRVEEFSRRILERTGSLGTGDFLKLHGSRREPHALDQDFFNPPQALKAITVAGVELKVGSRVILRPKHRADAFDLMLAGKTAIIEAIEQDMESQVHVAVVVEDDPGLDLGKSRQPGHRFFYRTDEVEPFRMEAAA